MARLSAGVLAVTLVLAALVLGLELVTFPPQEASKRPASVVVAGGIEIGHDFSRCVLRFANEGNVTDTTRSVMVFYTEAGNGPMITKNADPPPNLTLAPGTMADWNCSGSFAGIPPGIKGEAVNVVVSAVDSRERATAGNFT
jgi:uncharacterized membrane protein AbrB (regulator of aidB expression)